MSPWHGGEVDEVLPGEEPHGDAGISFYECDGLLRLDWLRPLAGIASTVVGWPFCNVTRNVVKCFYFIVCRMFSTLL